MGTEIKSEDRGAARHRRRLTTAIKESLRELSIQLSLLNHHVSGRLELNDVDLDCLDLISRHGPLSPSALARRASAVGLSGPYRLTRSRQSTSTSLRSTRAPT